MESWQPFFVQEEKQDYYKELMKFVDQEYAERTIFPPRHLLFSAFSKTPLDKVKVVILGQDPYHEEGQAHGLAFSVPEGTPVPPSLRNIFKEVGQPGYRNGDLTKWAESGVLLINCILTVRESSARSHANRGWEKFTDSLIAYISENTDCVCFMLWGSDAISREKLITNGEHYVLKNSHPSPLSAHRFCSNNVPFIGSGCFRLCRGLTGIDFNTANFMEI